MAIDSMHRADPLSGAYSGPEIVALAARAGLAGSPMPTTDDPTLEGQMIRAYKDGLIVRRLELDRRATCSDFGRYHSPASRR